MKIIPDPIHAKMRCASARVTSGTPKVIQFAVARLPADLIPSRWRFMAGPALLIIPACAVFYESSLMYPVVAVWLYVSWRIGSCAHCITESGEGDS